MSTPSESLPIFSLREQLLNKLEQGPVVIVAPTGTGKSTQVPRWIKGKTLVIQPRRVAARNVAARIAELEQVALGEEVGYRVRDEDCSSAQTRLLVVTPGIVLNQPALLDDFETTIVDEIHERRLDTDLILALALSKKLRLVAMSATVQGQEVADYLGGELLSVEARAFPVEIIYTDSGDLAPRNDRLASRIRLALEGLQQLSGDILVFLPGKAEIAKAAAELVGLRVAGQELDVRELHGGLKLHEQALALRDSPASSKPRVILTTNVAETSLTVPGVTVVIDSGLVRRTSYHDGRSYLGLSPIALDSASQRAGRAGRTQAGMCLRLWSQAFRLEAQTVPEIQRESLSPLLLSIARLGLKPEELRFLNPPRDFALEHARTQLVRLGALSEQGQLTATGHELSRLPLDPWLARVLIAARELDCLDAAIDLVAALEHPRAAQLAAAAPEGSLERLDCDLVALISAVRAPQDITGSAASVLREVLENRKRLRRALNVSGDSIPLNRDRLLSAIVAADPQAACVARKRASRLSFSSGGTELELSRDSRACRALEDRSNSAQKRPLAALIVLSTRAVQQGAMKRSLSINAASPVSFAFLARCGLGEEKVGRASYKGRRLSCEVERIWAGQNIASSEMEPQGELARNAIVQLVLQGNLHRPEKIEAERRLARRALAARLATHPDYPFFQGSQAPPEFADWLLIHLTELGVESGEDLKLLSVSDFLPDDVPAELAPTLDDRFPLEVDVGDCLYRAEYDLKKRQVLLSIQRGGRTTPPPAQYLPKFEGLKVFAEAGGRYHLVRRG